MAQWDRYASMSAEERKSSRQSANERFADLLTSDTEKTVETSSLLSRQSFSGRERNVFFRNEGDLTFTSLAGVWGLDLIDDGRSVAVGDFDNDGDQDLAIQSRPTGRPVMLLRNDFDRGQALRVQLEGTSVPMGVGAVVTATVGDRKLRRDVSVGSGYLSQSDPGVWFGLGSALVVQKIAIRWPNGTTERVGPVKAGRTIVVREGEGIVKGRPFRSATRELEAEALEPPPDHPVVADRVRIKGTDGSTFDLTKLGGNWILLEAFKTTCPACRAERKHLARLNRRFANRGLTTLGVAIGQPLETVAAYAREMNVAYPVGTMDAKSAAVFGDEKLPVPSVFLIDPRGRLIRTFRGRSQMADLDRILDRTLPK